ncbi:MAG: VOC family protein [Rhodobacteraceae bacterium]|nr:VOC family protein [Paracoccaceae bacterium]
MRDAILEHANITVSDIERTATMLCAVFGWRVRWASEPGAALGGGTSWHVGGDHSYIALYSRGGRIGGVDTYTTIGGMNHLGVVVSDLDATEERVKALGLETHSHADYEPGRRFYFNDHDGIEYEVVAYP